MAFGRSHERAENLEKQNGDAAEDKPNSGRPAVGSEKRHHTFQFAAGGRNGGPEGFNRVGLDRCSRCLLLKVLPQVQSCVRCATYNFISNASGSNSAKSIVRSPS